MKNNPYLSIIIPSYNEEKRLPSTLRKISDYLQSQSYDYEILVIDDGSSDNTSSVTKKSNIPGLSVYRYEQNRGKGFAVNYGVDKAKGKYILMCDADNATPFAQIETFLPNVHDYQVIIGSRYFENSRANKDRSAVRVFVAKLGNLLTQLILLPGIADTQCGFKLFEGNAAHRIFAHQSIWGWAFDMEILFIAKRMGYKIKVIPVEWNNASGSKIQSPLVFLSTFGELLKIKFRSMIKNYR